MENANTSIPVIGAGNAPAVQNQYGQVSLVGDAQGASLAMAAASAAEIIEKIRSAKMFPRDIVRAQKEIEFSCQRKSLADIATYVYAKGGTNVTGASIHLLRSIVLSWGNISSGYRPDHSRRASQNESYWIAYAIDYERNVTREIPFAVSNIRHTKKGDYVLTDPREIYENIANQAARRERACLEAVVPRDIVDWALELCQQTQVAREGAITKEKLDQIVEAYSEYGVRLEDIEAFIQRKIESIVPAQLAKLRSIFKSIRDGVASPGDFFKTMVEREAEAANADSPEKPRKRKGRALLEEAIPDTAPDAQPEGEPDQRQTEFVMT